MSTNARGTGMRILLDQAVHHHRNKGNNALLESSLNRLREFWPDASFDVVSIAPHLCRLCFPGTTPVSPHDLAHTPHRLETLQRVLPRPFWLALFELRELARGAGIEISAGSRRSSGSPEPTGRSTDPPHTERIADQTSHDRPPADRYPNVASYDLYVATGGGYLCDEDKRFLLPLLDRLEAAVAHRVPAAMVGQGVGPLDDPELVARAGQVLPSLDCIMVREQRFALPILDALGVERSTVMMTGDDAIELPYRTRRDSLGTGIGLSLRVARYTDVTGTHIEAIRRAAQRAGRSYDAELVAAPIDVNDSDLAYIRALMAGYGRTSWSRRAFETPAEVVSRVARCRIMISGTFHGAVFALAQGIPVIAPTNSTYQTMKLSGLAAEFGETGCQVVQLEGAGLEARLSDAIDMAWSSAPQLRPRLLEAASRQIALGREAYQRLFRLVEARRPRNA